MSDDKDIGSIVAWAAFDESGAIQPWAIKDTEGEVRELVLMVEGPDAMSIYMIERVAVHWYRDGREVRDVKAERIATLEERVRQLESENSATSKQLESAIKEAGKAAGERDALKIRLAQLTDENRELREQQVAEFEETSQEPTERANMLQERVKQLELENETLQSIVCDYQERFYDQRSSEGR